MRHGFKYIIPPQSLLSNRQTVRSKIFTTRNAYSIKANAALKSALTDLSVTVKFSENASSPEAEELIQQAMSWRTSPVPRAALVVQQVTVPKLLDAIRKTDPAPLLQVKDKLGQTIFNKTDALERLRVLAPPDVLFRLERCSIDELPSITVTKTVESIRLALMLSSDSQAPLIIDQPEDNLDSEFIYASLVPVLRAAKERRQIIVVTHNPNIAVLGDAEQIIAFKSGSEKSVVVARGSIDEPNTKDMVCRILEGAKEAFKKRDVFTSGNQFAPTPF